MKKILNSNLFMQIMKFGVVGVIAFLIDYLSLIFFKEILNVNLFISTMLAFTISVIINYILSVKYVFIVKGTSNRVIPFIVLSFIGLLLTELIMYLGVEVAGISYLIVKIFATGVVMIFNFVFCKILLEK